MAIPYRTDRMRVRTDAPGSAAAESGGPLSALPRRSSRRPSSTGGPVSRRGPGGTSLRTSACAGRTRTGTVPPVRCRAVRSTTVGAGANVEALPPPPARLGPLEPQGAPPGAAVERWPRMTPGATRRLPGECETAWSSLGLFGREGRFSLPAAVARETGVRPRMHPACTTRACFRRSTVMPPASRCGSSPGGCRRSRERRCWPGDGTRWSTWITSAAS